MYSVILSTCSNEKEAENIAEALLDKKLAACVNIVGNAKSLYWWKGKVVRAEECLMFIKTRKSLVEKVTQLIKKLHSYEVPEAIELQIGKGNKDYLKWISEVTR